MLVISSLYLWFMLFLMDWNADCYWKSTRHFILIGRIIFFGLASQETNLAAMLNNNMAARWVFKDCNGLGRCGPHQGVETVVQLVPIGLREFRWLDLKPRLMRNLDCVWVSPPLALWCSWSHCRSNCRRHTPWRQVEFLHRSKPDHVSSPWLNSPQIFMPT